MNTSFVTCLFSVWLLLTVEFVDVVGGWKNCSEPVTSCGSLIIRFPFRIIGRQPPHCGYPGFGLECSPSNHTVLELPRSVKLNVKSIDYKSQLIDLYDPNGCFLKLVDNFSLSASHFQFRSEPDNEYTLFNCSPTNTDIFDRVPCVSSSTYQVVAISSIRDVQYLPLSFCTKISTISSILYEFPSKGGNLHLMWSDPQCKHCESKGKICRLKNDSTNYETECFEDHKGSQTKIVKLTTGSIVGSLLLVLVTTAAHCIYRFHRLKKQNQAIIEKFLKDYRALKPTRYSYAEIKRITNQFKEKLGEGAYGTVFKGQISSQFTVAVKILTHSQGNGEDFINEVGTMGRIHHVNIVRLIGFCADGFRRALVYDLLPNGSLQKFIHSSENRQNFLGWEKLHEIALGIAKGVEYIHHGCDQRILHFDIKPHNVLLDHDFTPKICDFGLAKLCSKDQSLVSMTTARGTMGYIAPEVFSRNFGNVSYKSDVYSFGMLLLETIGGRKITEDTAENTSHVHYPEWIYNVLEEREEVRIHVDERDAKIARRLAIVGLRCIQWHAVDRPSMQAVVQMLEGEGDQLEVPPNPFASEGSSTRRASMPGRHLIQSLEIIHELE